MSFDLLKIRRDCDLEVEWIEERVDRGRPSARLSWFHDPSICLFIIEHGEQE